MGVLPSHPPAARVKGAGTATPGKIDGLVVLADGELALEDRNVLRAAGVLTTELPDGTGIAGGSLAATGLRRTLVTEQVR